MGKLGKSSMTCSPPKSSEIQSAAVVALGLTSGFQISPGPTVMFVFCPTSCLITFTWHARWKSLPDCTVRAESSMAPSPGTNRMAHHRVLHLWLCCGGSSNWLTVPMVLAQLRCFNHDMSMLLPGKLWMQFWPLFLLCCLFLGALPIYIAPKKRVEYPYSNATQKGRFWNGNLNPPPSSSKTPPSLLSLTTTYGIVALIGLHFAAAPTTLLIALSPSRLPPPPLWLCWYC